ncbi:ParA family protein [Thiobacter aerophilum]|uniref:ParA family protein n=1 Tax=Thiobacter aerophilum TaxID=3121275 RepID=A0ABV0EFH7_9BURK
MAVIAVFNQKGGVGKTTTTLNVAAALARMGKDPIAIDLDPQAHLTLSVGLAQITGADSVAAFFREEKVLAQLTRELPNGVRIIPAHMELSKIEALNGRSASAARRLKAGLEEELAREGVPILIDCCPMLGVLSLNAILAADRVLVPVSADFLSFQGVRKLDLALRALEGPLGRRIEKRIVLTRFDARRKLAFEIHEKLRERFGDEVCETRVVENVALATSPTVGKDVLAFQPGSPGARDYMRLTLELWDRGFFT